MDDEGCYPSDALWAAEKDGFRFMVDNPIGLLGLVGVYNHMQPLEDRPYWWRKEGEDVLRKIMSEAFPQRDAGDE